MLYTLKKDTDICVLSSLRLWDLFNISEKMFPWVACMWTHWEQNIYFQYLRTTWLNAGPGTEFM